MADGVHPFNIYFWWGRRLLNRGRICLRNVAYPLFAYKEYGRGAAFQKTAAGKIFLTKNLFEIRACKNPQQQVQ